MKRAITALAITAAILLAPTSAYSHESRTHTDTVFLKTIHQYGKKFHLHTSRKSDNLAIKMGKSTCAALDANVAAGEPLTYQEVIIEVLTPSLNGTHPLSGKQWAQYLGFVTGAATAAYCPQYGNG